MHTFIDFIMGEMVIVSFVIFIAGTCGRLLWTFIHINKTENFIFSYLSFKYSLRSILAWLTPFLPVSSRKKPFFYSISYTFHILLFIVPIFLLSHITLFEEYLNWSWISINDTSADILTIIVILCTLFFVTRRVVVKEVKYITRTSDFVFIIIASLPFITGFLAYHQLFAYKIIMIAHVISGEIMLILIPFTRFFHMFIAPIIRAYTGSEFGNVRGAKDW
ncbi:MAG: nitrate reductase [Desulfobacterales bacterium]|nr:nitrate reductase [Desulfobacterales bacterium]